MIFPAKEMNVYDLALEMNQGLLAHALDFPNVDQAGLASAITMYENIKQNADNAKAAAKQATAGKNAALADLEKVMRTALKQAEIDCVDSPGKLYDIGWGPKSGPTPTGEPAQPTDFVCTEQQDSEVSFAFKRGEGPFRANCFILQRRQKNPDTGEFGNWEMVNFYYDTMITVPDQPTGVKLEYRVVASNNAGQSLASNIASVVL